MYKLLKDLFPICRSITGGGNRQTLKMLNQEIPIKIEEFQSGTQCYDWTIPDEWNIKEAYIENETGTRIVDFQDNNLHVVNYSEPVNGTFSLDELKSHIYSIPEKPELIPYATSYYKRDWGFCMSHDQLEKLKPGNYNILIDSTIRPGSLTIGEAFLNGKSKKEVLISSYICHPSMANDSLSGVVLAVQIFKHLFMLKNRRYSYRFVFLPETIGAIVYLFHHGKYLKKYVHAGLVLTCLGDPNSFNYKCTRQGNHELDEIVKHVFKHSGHECAFHDFFPYGSDERQYSSPGFNLPIGSLMRSIYGRFREYHTSGDNLDFVTEDALNESFEIYSKVFNALESNKRYMRDQPYCEPMLAKYNLHDTVGYIDSNDNKDAITRTVILKWLLNYSDGEHSLLDIANKIDISIDQLSVVAGQLEEKGIIYSV